MPTLTLNPGATTDVGSNVDGGSSFTGLNSGPRVGDFFGTQYWAMMRFPSAGVDQGVTINSAELRILNDNGTGGTDFGTVYGVDEDNAATGGSGNLPENATQTTESTSLTSTNYDALDVTDIVQEIVNRAGFDDTSAIAFVVDGTAAGSNDYLNFLADGSAPFDDIELYINCDAGGATYVGGDYTNEAANTTDLSVTFPTLENDDFAILVGTCDDDAPALGLSGVSGWANDVSLSTTGGRDKATELWTKRVTSSETAPTVTIDTAQEHGAALVVIRGIDTTTALDVAITTSTGTNDATPTAPAITTATDNAILVTIHLPTHNDVTSAGAPSGFTLAGNAYSTGTPNHRQIFVAYKLDAGTAGLQTIGDWTHTVSDATIAEYHCITIALRLAAESSDTEVDASTEALSLTTNSASIAVDVGVGASAESLTLSTHAASVAFGQNVDVATEGLSLTTQQADIAVDVTIPAQVEGLTLNTFPAGVTFDRVVSAGIEGQSLTTYPAGVSFGVGVQAGTEDLSLTTLQASVVFDVEVSTASAGLTIETHPASIAIGAGVPVGTANLTLEALPASISLDVSIPAGIAGLDLATFPAGVQLASGIPAAVAELSLQTYQATVSHDVGVSASTAILGISTHQATVTLSGAINSGSVALSLETHPANIGYDQPTQDTQPGGWLPIKYVDRNGNEIDLDAVADAVEQAVEEVEEQAPRKAVKVRKVSRKVLSALAERKDPRAQDIQRLKRAISDSKAAIQALEAAIEAQQRDNDEVAFLLLMAA